MVVRKKKTRLGAAGRIAEEKRRRGTAENAWSRSGSKAEEPRGPRRWSGSPRSRRRGSATSEFTAAIALLLPITLIAGFVAFQISQVYMIKTTLEYAAHTAARRLALAYGQNPTTAMAFPDQVFDTVRLEGMVVSSQQLSIPQGTAGWNETANPATVTVIVTFQGGQYGLPPFPNPDPLGLGQNFQLTASGTANLE